MQQPAPPKLILAGGNGFLGKHLRQHFSQLGYRVVLLSRSAATEADTVRWDARTLGAWSAELEGADLLVNMAGRSVDCRYTEAHKREILTSRVDSTRVLGEAVAACTRPPRVWLNSSTATIYAHTEGEQPANTEAAGVIGTGFSVEVATAWEAVLWAAPTPHTRRVALRTSIVLGRDGGAFPVIAKLARRGLGSPQGSGRQWVSWLHVADFCRAVAFLATQTTEAGAFNVCAPHPLPNEAFNALLCRALRPLVRLPQPEWLLQLGAWLLQTETELILKSRKVVPQRLVEAGFVFQYPTCERAIKDLLGA